MSRFAIFTFLCVLTLATAGAPAYATEKAAEGAEEPPPFEYVQLQPLILPVITDKGLTQQVSLVVSIELPYGKMKDVTPYEPRLADAYLRDLYGRLGAGGAMMRGNLIDVEAVKSRLTTVTSKILGEGTFNEVLLQVIHQRQM